MRAICGCGKVMIPDKNGVVIQLYEGDRPVKQVHSDRWACPDCGAKVYVGFGREIYEHEPAYNALLVDVNCHY